MTRVLPPLLLFLTGFASAAWLPAEDALIGGWHAFNESQGRTFFYLVYDGEETRIYDQDWKRVLADVAIEKGSISFRVPGREGSLIEGKLEGRDLRGIFTKPHPQMTLKGKWSARRFVGDGSWQPFAFTRTANQGVVDSGKLVSRLFPIQDYTSFEKAWAREVEPDFYPALAASLYSTESGFYGPDNRDKRIREIFETLKELPSAQFKTRAEELPAQLVEVKRVLYTKYPWLDLKSDISTLFVPSGGLFDFRLEAMGLGKLVLVIASDWMAKLSKNQVSHLLAQALVYEYFKIKNSFRSQVFIELTARGLGASISAEVFGANDPSQFLFLDPETQEEDLARYPAMRKDLFLDSRRMWPLAMSKYLLGRNRPVTYLAMYRFANVLRQRYSLEQMLSPSAPRLREEYAAFLNLNQKLVWPEEILSSSSSPKVSN